MGGALHGVESHDPHVAGGEFGGLGCDAVGSTTGSVGPVVPSSHPLTG